MRSALVGAATMRQVLLPHRLNFLYLALVTLTLVTSIITAPLVTIGRVQYLLGRYLVPFTLIATALQLTTTTGLADSLFVASRIDLIF
jgi:hypothetical protein